MELVLRHKKVFCIVSKGSADGKSSFFQMPLTLAASFGYVSLPQKNDMRYLQIIFKTKICEPPHLLYSGL